MPGLAQYFARFCLAIHPTHVEIPIMACHDPSMDRPHRMHELPHFQFEYATADRDTLSVSSSMTTDCRMPQVPKPVHLIRIDDGTILLGPFDSLPPGNDPFVEVSTDNRSFWVKHSRRGATPAQLEVIQYWARRLVAHQSSSFTGVLGIVSAEVRSSSDHELPQAD